MTSLAQSISLRCSLRLTANSAKFGCVALATLGGPDSERSKMMLTSPRSSVGAMMTAFQTKPRSSIFSSPTGVSPRAQSILRRRKLSVSPKKRHTANVFITPERAYIDYLLTPTDLEGLWRTKRRSPFDDRLDIDVYLRVDVEKRAVDIWGSMSRLELEKQRRRRQETEHPQEALGLLTAMRSYTAVMDTSKSEQMEIKKLIRKERKRRQRLGLSDRDRTERRLLQGSGRVVWSAIGVNAANAVLKLIVYMHTGSSAMFSEMVHSLADTLNQAILAFGIWQSRRTPDHNHPYGWYNFSYVSSLISGVGIFFVGAGLSWFHGIQALMHPAPIESISWALALLAMSFVSEGGTLIVALRQIRREANAANLSFAEFVRRGYDPSVNVVLAEDCVAVIGVGVAVVCLSLSSHFSSHIPDGVGSLIIGTLLAGVASHIVYTNAITLVGQSIPTSKRELMRHQLESDRIIRAVHDIKATEMGAQRVRFKAEVDIDGRELTRIYMDSVDVDEIQAELYKASKSPEGLQSFMLRQGEAIVDLIGAEIDRVEQELKTKHPEVRHVDLEVL